MSPPCAVADESAAPTDRTNAMKCSVPETTAAIRCLITHLPRSCGRKVALELKMTHTLKNRPAAIQPQARRAALMPPVKKDKTHRTSRKSRFHPPGQKNLFSLGGACVAGHHATPPCPAQEPRLLDYPSSLMADSRVRCRPQTLHQNSSPRLNRLNSRIVQRHFRSTRCLGLISLTLGFGGGAGAASFQGRPREAKQAEGEPRGRGGETTETRAVKPENDP